MDPNNPLLQALLQRQLAQQGAQVQPAQPLPVVPPSVPSRVPPATQRWKNAQAMQQAIRNNWTPNPTILQATQSK